MVVLVAGACVHQSGHTYDCRYVPRLPSVPVMTADPSNAWDTGALMAWVASLADPLLAPGVAAGATDRARRECGADPAGASSWLAGWTRDMLVSLPGPDPWRHLSARAPGARGGQDVVVRGWGEVPTRVGATTARGRFGTWGDGTDLLVPQHRNPSADVGLAALAAGLPDASAAFLAAAGESMSAAGRALDGLCHGSGAAIFDVAAPALRWAAWRRRVYAGAEDEHFVLTGIMWLEWASGARHVDASEFEANRRGGALDDDLYAPVTGT